MTSVAVDGLSVTLDRAIVLAGVSCTVPAGGWLALIGPNGAGKSTLVRAAAGLFGGQEVQHGRQQDAYRLVKVDETA